MIGDCFNFPALILQMKHTIEGIIELALEDSDLWVKLVAGIIKTYPMTFNLNLDLRSSPIAQHVLQQAAEKGISVYIFFRKI